MGNKRSGTESQHSGGAEQGEVTVGTAGRLLDVRNRVRAESAAGGTWAGQGPETGMPGGEK